MESFKLKGENSFQLLFYEIDLPFTKTSIAAAKLGSRLIRILKCFNKFQKFQKFPPTDQLMGNLNRGDPPLHIIINKKVFT